MKKFLITFASLFFIFIFVWIFKSKNPANRPITDNSFTNEGLWWADEENLPKPSEDWVLDPEIPENYIPVPGEDELYMVIDENGLITKYRQREKQEDGSWVWETVNPDIPKNYEAVEGLTDVYKVVNEDKSVSYFKYIRNEDDTFAFIPVDEHGNPIENKAPTGEEIPSNYVRITGNIYAVYNENNVIVGYKERSIDENGKYVWKDCEKPEPPAETDKSESDETSKENNDQSNPADESKPDTSKPDTSKPDISNPDTSKPETSNPDVSFPTAGRTETEVITTYEISGNWKITYETIVTRTYDENNELVSTKKEGPKEVNRTPITDTDKVPDKSLIKGTLVEELARVKIGLLFDTDLAKEVLVILNAERAAANIGPLTMNEGSSSMLLSQIRCIDMATFGHTDYNSPMYGTIDEMCDQFKVTAKSGAAEIVWKTGSDRSAEAIASRIRIMANESINNPDFTSIGLTIVSKGGFYYINVVLL